MHLLLLWEQFFQKDSYSQIGGNVAVLWDVTVLSSDESKLSMYSCTVSSTGPSSTRENKIINCLNSQYKINIQITSEIFLTQSICRRNPPIIAAQEIVNNFLSKILNEFASGSEVWNIRYWYALSCDCFQVYYYRL